MLLNPTALGTGIIPMGCVQRLAVELNYRPVIFWTRDIETGKVRFADLFDTTNLPFELVENCEIWLMARDPHPKFKFLESHRRRIQRLILSQFDAKMFINRQERQDAFMEWPTTDFLMFRKIFTFPYQIFRYGYDLSWLKPAPQIVHHITELKQRFAPNTVGIHFRGTDWRHTHEITPPIKKIIARMRAEVELDPEVNFFLASDGDEDERKIMDVFGDRLIMNTHSAERRTLRGQQDAVVDLFGLAATSRIIGFNYSSFTMLAALIGNKPILKIKADIKSGKPI